MGSNAPVCALALTKHAWFFELHHKPIDSIREEYGGLICADDTFWEQRRDASYATLIELAEPTSIEAFPVFKRDRRGWVALTPTQLTLNL